MFKVFVKKFTFLLIAIGLIFSFAVPNTTYALTSAQLKAQKAAEAEAARQQAAAKAAQAAQFQAQIDNITATSAKTEDAIAATAGEISQTQASIDDFKSQIAVKEGELAIEKGKMNQLLASWYMDGEQEFFESIVSSNSLSDLVTTQENYDAIKQQIDTQLGRLNQIKYDLTTQKEAQEAKAAELANLQQQQQSYQRTLSSQKQQKSSLLNMTLAQQAQYLEIAKKAEQEVARISAEEAARRRAAGNISSGGTGGYPYSNSDALDPWYFYQLQCTSYAAWYWNVKLGKEWTNTQPGRGSARYWDEIANTMGYSVSSTPRVGAIISWKGPLYSGDQWGHVAIVQKVNADGTIDLSEYNWIPYSYSYRTNVTPSNYGSYVYIY